MDESSFVIAPHIVRAWLPTGKRISVKTNYTRQKFHAIGVINGRKEHYSFIQKINSKEILRFVKRLQARYPRLLIFLDQAPWHKTKKFLKWCKQKNVRLIQFPSYSPELNPVEPAWKEIKNKTANTYYKNKEEYKKAAKKATRTKKLNKMFKYFNY